MKSIADGVLAIEWVKKRLNTRYRIHVTTQDAGFGRQRKPTRSDNRCNAVIVKTANFGNGNRLCFLKPAAIDYCIDCTNFSSVVNH
ncbi:hypothetical protein A4R26_11205 [Niastella populi]|uniref:Uncharacterized protein n=1 Tax=Niastella populi TaxID=550983 RepID=A0A1V9GBK3_9BACT|nr:hypothetical protein A4R26_11205 [Niastella populi]